MNETQNKKGRKPKEKRYHTIFADKLKLLLDEKDKSGVTLSAVATALDVTRQSLAQYRDGNNIPDIVVLQRMAEYFGVSSDYLLTDTEIRTTDTEMKAVCEYTGLSEDVIIALNKIKNQDEEEILYDYILEIVDYLISREKNTNLLAALYDYLIEDYELVCIPQNESLADFLWNSNQDNGHYPAMLSKRDNRAKVKAIEIKAILLSQIQEALIRMKAGD